LLSEIADYVAILADEKRIYAMIRDDTLELKKKHADQRRTEISGEEVGTIDLEDLIAEETMVVTITHNGYIKRTPASTYRAQRRGGKGLKGAKADEEDPIEHLFVASTHAYLLFFTSKGKVHWQKVYDLPQLGRESKGRAIVNLLRLGNEETIADCRAVRDFDKPGYFLMMATRKGLVKKTPLEQYSRPLKSGIIAIKLREDDELVDVVLTKPGDEAVLATAQGMAIRFSQADVRPMGRNTSGVKGIALAEGDHLVGMVIADPDATLLTVCANGYGKRTPFGPNLPAEQEQSETASGEPEAADESDEEQPEASSSQRYRTQRRGGKGLRDIKTTERNGPVIGIVPVGEEDELLMMSARGKIQRVEAKEISVIGRNTQGVRIMTLDEGDTLAAVVRVPRENDEESESDAS
jgi:DNA gyrase subunit A